AELGGGNLELVLDHRPQLVLVLQDRLDLLRLGGLLRELLADHVDLELGELVQLELEDRIGLDVVELELLLDLDRGVVLAVRAADQLDQLIERVEDRDEAVEDVDPVLELGELVLEAPLDDLEPEVEEVAERLLDAGLA